MRLWFVKLQIFECYTVVTSILASSLRAPTCTCIVGAIADGAIMESGSNSNGYWCKLADGTLLMQGRYNAGSTTEPANIAITNKIGNHYYSDPITFTLPYAAYSEQSGGLAIGQHPGWGGTNAFWFWGGVVSSVQGQARLYSSVSTTIDQIHLQWVFQGRWKA